MTSADVESLFLDTNVLVYANVAQAPLHQLALQTIQAYDAGGRQLWISRQIIREYLATVTRPQTFATAMPMGLAVARARYFQQRFHVAEETADVTTRLLTLLEQVPTAWGAGARCQHCGDHAGLRDPPPADAQHRRFRALHTSHYARSPCADPMRRGP